MQNTLKNSEYDASYVEAGEIYNEPSSYGVPSLASALRPPSPWSPSGSVALAPSPRAGAPPGFEPPPGKYSSPPMIMMAFGRN